MVMVTQLTAMLPETYWAALLVALVLLGLGTTIWALLAGRRASRRGKRLRRRRYSGHPRGAS